MESTSPIYCHLCSNPTQGGGVCSQCYETLPLVSEIKREDNTNKLKTKSPILCNLCSNPTQGGGVCSPCYETLPLESEIKREEDTEMSDLDMKLAEKFIQDWLKFGGDFFMNGYIPKTLKIGNK